MSQHFLLSAAARTLSLAKVLRMSQTEAETVFARIRWEETEGRPVCPACGCDAVYDCRRPNGAPRWRCKACRKDFSLTSGTLFAFHKLPLVIYLAAIAIFVNEVKGKSALAMSRDLGVQYKTAFVLAHKIREAMGADIKGAIVGGEGKAAEIDGAYFGGHVRPENKKADRKDRRLAENQTGKRRCVVTIRERDGRTLTGVFPSEDAANSFIKTRIAKGTDVHADESPAWNSLHARYAMHRINHQEAYSLDGACTNEAESFFSRLRRAEIGHHHHISGIYLHRYAQEAAFREDCRRDSNGMQFRRVVSLVTKNGPSVDFCGYWQRSRSI
ncbi:IS1595 family transposase [Azospirillum sp. RWY-5-1]|uniref:IS1595 family transposase n=1 Tax=Azospirillum oleiclasticum TaxID=2735135 RepID=A0ABX2TIE2_9PROT|nr:IS1595 family transposase [Azospirillum oleiclasticum]NYZ16635.1 IS1595 family transposase [Azospirillum oleiclasticum]NYZ24122.1 IS1595 family transposase [Azospirillum oleiclasticum]